jgi:hypothetical protein
MAHSAISAIQTGLLDSSTIGYVASALVLAAFGMKDMVNLRIVAICSKHSLHRVWDCVESAARIDPARRPFATERLATDGGIEATQRDGGGSVFRSAPTCRRLHSRLTFLAAH